MVECWLDVRQSDGGLYTCTASSASGESGWSAIILVDGTNGTSDPLPSPPSPPTGQPTVVDASHTSVTLSWLPSNHHSVTGYTVQYYSPDLQTGWVTVARSWNSTVIQVRVEIKNFGI